MVSSPTDSQISKIKVAVTLAMKASEKKIVANRRNAQKSTGPKSARGKRAVSQNARRHGLSTALDAGSMKAANKLTDVVVGDSLVSVSREKAFVISEAQICLLNVRAVRGELLGMLLEATGDSLARTPSEALPDVDELLTQVVRLERYERRAISRRRRAMRGLQR